MCHTQRVVRKIGVTLEHHTVAELDRWVREGKYPNRSKALQSAVTLLSEKQKRTRLARELAKLNRAEERKLAEEGMGTEEWPPY
jgi:Arc/MetJ-type ribon-helix-helix transcriptional regulator